MPVLTFADWLRGRTDEQLLTLLRLRPDLAAPPPQDLTTLAARIPVRSSVQRCLDDLDAFALHVLQALAVLTEPSTAAVAAGMDAGTDDVAAGVQRLYDRALIFDGPAIRFVTGVTDLLGPFPLGLGAPAAYLLSDVPTQLLVPVLATLDLAPATQPAAGRAIAGILENADRRAALLAHLRPSARGLLTAVATSDLPVAPLPGQRGATADDLAVTEDLQELVLSGLLIFTGADTGEVPLEVGLDLRGRYPLGSCPADPPPAYTTVAPQQRLDATGSGAVLELLRQVDALAVYWTDEPPNQLRHGGLGVRDLRRTARQLGMSEQDTAVLLEVCVAADLVSAPMAHEVPWRPTTRYDKWTQLAPAPRWVALAQAWLTMTRLPYLAGRRDERGKALNVLSYELERAGAGVWRRQVLQPLLESPPGASGTPEVVLANLAWRLPRRLVAQIDASTAALAEAELIGLTAAGGLTSYGRVLLGDAGQNADNVEQALHAVLPEPVNEFLLQPDLTAVVPGPPTRELGTELRLVGDLESSGGASVYRITERSLRRAFDLGRPADAVHQFFADRSRTPVPQALTYLIDDLARRYGLLRAGSAQSYLRCEDPALLDRVLSDRATTALGWHRLAPTVALAVATTEDVLEVLRGAGYTPAGEDVTGGLQILGSAPERSRPRRQSARTIASVGLDDAQLAELVRRLRTSDNLARTAHRVSVTPNAPGVTSAGTLGVLRDAIRAEHKVWLSVADATGTPDTYVLEPMSLGGGYLRGFDVDSAQFVSVPLHRITSLNVLTEH